MKWDNVKKIEAKIIAHSRVGSHEIITYALKYGRIIHSELLRTRTISHSVKSSRAIPSKLYRAEVLSNPYVPVHFGLNQKGMQAGKETHRSRQLGRLLWKTSSKVACVMHYLFEKSNIHKEITNRLIEPYVWTEETVTVERCDLDALVELRVHPDAQPDIAAIVEQMNLALIDSEPVEIKQGEFHLPYIREDENLTTEQKILCSAARCARSSYAKHDGTETNIENDLKLAKRLYESKHWSPFEHQVRSFNYQVERDIFPSNFKNFLQVRKMLESQHPKTFEEAVKILSQFPKVLCPKKFYCNKSVYDESAFEYDDSFPEDTDRIIAYAKENGFLLSREFAIDSYREFSDLIFSAGWIELGEGNGTLEMWLDWALDVYFAIEFENGCFRLIRRTLG